MHCDPAAGLIETRAWSLQERRIADLIGFVIGRAAPLGGELLARQLPGERAACVPCGAASGFRFPVSTFRYESMQEPRTALRLRIREIVQTRLRYGYRKIRVLLNREGWKVGKKVGVSALPGRRLDPATQAAPAYAGSQFSIQKEIEPEPVQKIIQCFTCAQQTSDILPTYFSVNSG